MARCCIALNCGASRRVGRRCVAGARRSAAQRNIAQPCFARRSHAKACAGRRIHALARRAVPPR
eukprot:407706-Lingulodinium_polyedra.AAC.1